MNCNDSCASCTCANVDVVIEQPKSTSEIIECHMEIVCRIQRGLKAITAALDDLCEMLQSELDTTRALD